MVNVFALFSGFPSLQTQFCQIKDLMIYYYTLHVESFREIEAGVKHLHRWE